MSGIMECVALVLRMLSDKRMRMDVKALKYAAEGYKSYAWELCKSVGIDIPLKSGADIEEIMRENEIRNRVFLEHVLDFLTGEGVLEYRNGKYVLVNEPKGFDGSAGHRFLKKYYPNSVEWTNVLRKKSKKTLMTGRKDFSAGFDHKRFLMLWEGIMKESPWSFRRMAIQKFSKKISDGADILDLGCGSGVSTEQILLECRKPVRITGMDQSETSLKRARKRIEDMKTGIKDPVLKGNLERIRLEKHNVLQGVPTRKKYDVIFMSLLLNHVPPERRRGFFINVKKMLKENGAVVVYQIIHQSRFRRAPMWVMHAVPTHRDYPFRDDYLNMLHEVFGEAKPYLGGTIVVCSK